MPPWAEVLRDRPMGREEPLSVARGLEPVHVSFALTGRLVRALGAIIEIPVLAMFYPWEQLALGGCVAFEFVGDDDTRNVHQALEQIAEELLGRPLVPAALHQDIQHVPVLIDCPPQIVMFALNRQAHLIEVPFVPRPRTAATQLIRIRLSEFAAPFANGLIGDDYATFEQQFFHIAETQAEAKVQPHRVADDLNRKAMVLIFSGNGLCLHATTLPHPVYTRQVDDAKMIGHPW